MNDKDIEQRTPNPGSAKLTTPRSHWKRWRFKSSVVLMLLGVSAIIVYLLRSGLAKQYEGVGAALCAIACGGFLVWHAVHLFAEEDAFDEQQPSFPQPNPVGKETKGPVN
jgi:hypothetical protein